MKISELIEILESTIKNHGDIEACHRVYNHLNGEYVDDKDISVTILVTTPYQQTMEEVCVILS